MEQKDDDGAIQPAPRAGGDAAAQDADVSVRCGSADCALFRLVQARFATDVLSEYGLALSVRRRLR